jgi:hypothetical protein
LRQQVIDENKIRTSLDTWADLASAKKAFHDGRIKWDKDLAAFLDVE